MNKYRIHLTYPIAFYFDGRIEKLLWVKLGPTDSIAGKNYRFVSLPGTFDEEDAFNIESILCCMPDIKFQKILA